MSRNAKCVILTAKQVHGSGGGQVHASRTCPRRSVGVLLAYAPPLPITSVIMETELAAMAHEAWVTQTAFSFLGQNMKSKNRLRSMVDFVQLIKMGHPLLCVFFQTSTFFSLTLSHWPCSEQAWEHRGVVQDGPPQPWWHWHFDVDESQRPWPPQAPGHKEKM